MSRVGKDEDAPKAKIGKSLFLTILGLIISGESEMVKAVDYVTGMLLDDTINQLLEMSNEWFGRTKKQETWRWDWD